MLNGHDTLSHKNAKKNSFYSIFKYKPPMKGITWITLTIGDEVNYDLVEYICQIPSTHQLSRADIEFEGSTSNILSDQYFK